MQVLVMGSGGLGGYYGGMLAERGHDVTFVARGAHLTAMRARGLEIRTNEQTYHITPVRAVAAPGDASGEFDLVLFTVKGYDAEAAATALHPIIGPQTAVLTLLNGVDSPELLSSVLGPEHVLAGTTFIRSTLAGPGIIEQMGTLRRVVFGEMSGGVTPRVEMIAAALREAGTDAVTRADSRLAVWEKFVMQAPARDDDERLPDALRPDPRDAGGRSALPHPDRGSRRRRAGKRRPITGHGDRHRNGGRLAVPLRAKDLDVDRLRAR